MSHGLPDFYRGVDIAYQALAQMIIRPKYGGAKQLSANKVAVAMQEVTLGTVSGKGMIYGGIIFLDYTDSQEVGQPELYIDNVIIADFRFDMLEKYGVIAEHEYAIYLLKKDETNYVYCVALSSGITFETSFSIRYYESNGTTPTVYCRINYALI